METPGYGVLLGAAIILVFCVANAKAIPFVYTLRLLPSIFRLLRHQFFKTTAEIRPPSELPAINASPALFKHHTTHSSAVLLDLDIFIHKANSTYFTDADISRANLLSSLFSESLVSLGPALPLLAGIQCRFCREIGPFKAYVISSRILAWDEKTLYTVTYFLKPNTSLPASIELPGGPAAVLNDEKLRKHVYAIMVTKYVFKAGRKTIAPETVLLAAELLHQEKKDGNYSMEVVNLNNKNGLQFVENCIL